MSEVRFADTSFYVAMMVSRDQDHARAMELATPYSGKVVTTEFVLLETANFLGSRGHRAEFLNLVEGLRTDRRTRVVGASRAFFRHGLRLFSDRQDKGWSLTDCTSFVVMDRLGLSDALTADRHFTQAGFKALML